MIESVGFMVQTPSGVVIPGLASVTLGLGRDKRRLERLGRRVS